MKICLKNRQIGRNLLKYTQSPRKLPPMCLNLIMWPHWHQPTLKSTPEHMVMNNFDCSASLSFRKRKIPTGRYKTAQLWACFFRNLQKKPKMKLIYGIRYILNFKLYPHIGGSSSYCFGNILRQTKKIIFSTWKMKISIFEWNFSVLTSKHEKNVTMEK